MNKVKIETIRCSGPGRERRLRTVSQVIYKNIIMQFGLWWRLEYDEINR